MLLDVSAGGPRVCGLSGAFLEPREYSMCLRVYNTGEPSIRAGESILTIPE